MSVLLIGLGPDLTKALLEALHPEKATVMVPEAAEADLWKDKATVLVGDLGDYEGARRACAGIDVVVAGDYFPVHRAIREGLANVLEPTDVRRVVVVGAGEPDELVGGVQATDAFDHVLLRFRRRGVIRHVDAVEPDRLAAAVVAAMKLDGSVRLDLDLTDRSSWAALDLVGDAPA